LRRLRALWRLSRFVVHGLHGALICALIFPFLDAAARARRVGWASSRALKLLGVTLHCDGRPRPGPLLLVGNHVSWLDILAINAVQPARFVAKADVQSWPLLGWMIACGGTLFIERERKRDAMRVLHEVASALQAGDVIAVFPEGTTGDGRTLLPFHANLLQAAITTGTPVQALALRYSDAGSEISAAATWVGETTLVQSVWRILTADTLTVTVRVLAPQGTRHLDRRALAHKLREEIAQALDGTAAG